MNGEPRRVILRELVRLSRRKPPGNVNHWPIGDYHGYIVLVEAAEDRDEDHPVDRVTLAAKALGLHPRHWLVFEVLTGTYRKFPMHGGRCCYAENAETFLKRAPSADLLDRETVEFACRLVEMPDHGPALLSAGLIPCRTIARQ